MPRLIDRFDLPDNKDSNYQLDPLVSLFSVVLPRNIDKTNLVTNPSIETNTNGYTLISLAAPSQDFTVQKFGGASLKVIPSGNANSGVGFQPWTSVTGVLYYGSVWFKGQAGFKYSFYFSTTGFSAVGSVASYVATGYWQRLVCTFIETGGTTRGIVITRDATTIQPFWIDGLQIEQDELTTYIDGDQIGLVSGRSDYYWTGIAHASTSVRSGQSASGGKVIPLSQAGFRMTDIVGLGLGGVTNFITPKSIGGAYYSGTVIKDRPFSLAGRLYGTQTQELQRSRQALIDLFKPDIEFPPQPLVLKYNPVDECGNQIGNEQDILAVFEGDLSANLNNWVQENIALNFRLITPYTSQEVGNSAAQTSGATSVTANDIMQRSVLGAYSAMGSGMNGAVTEIVADTLNRRIYVAGAFTTGNGVTLNRIGYWNGTTFVAMDAGTGAGQVNTIAIAANGDVWIGGTFLTVGSGAVATKGIARWNFATSNWTAFNLATTTFTAVTDIVIDSNGIVYVAGNFTDMNGNASADHIIKWNGAAWSALGTGLSLDVAGMAVDKSTNRVYIAGNFITGNGVTLNSVGYWNGTTFVSMGGGIAGGANFGSDVDVAPDGSVYCVGRISTIGGVAANNIAKWNGASWSPLGSGLSGGSADVLYVRVMNNGFVFVSNGFTVAGGYTATNQSAVWNGLSWFIFDVTTPGAITAVAELNGSAYLGMTAAGAASTPGITTVNNTGSASTGPKLVLTGPQAAVQLKNWTNGKTLYFNVTLQSGEVATLDLSNPSKISFVSNFRGNILGTIISGSDLASFFLAPGNNAIAFFITGSGVGTNAVLQWRISYHGIDGYISARLVP